MESNLNFCTQFFGFFSGFELLRFLIPFDSLIVEFPCEYFYWVNQPCLPFGFNESLKSAIWLSNEIFFSSSRIRLNLTNKGYKLAATSILHSRIFSLYYDIMFISFSLHGLDVILVSLDDVKTFILNSKLYITIQIIHCNKL